MAEGYLLMAASRRSFIKSLLAVGTGLAGTGLLAACQPAAPAAAPTPAPSKPAPAAPTTAPGTAGQQTAPAVKTPVKLSVLFPVNTDVERDALLKRMELFGKENPAIELSIQHTTWGKLGELVQTRVLAGDEPSVMLATPERFAFFTPKLMDLKPYMPAGLEKEFSPDGWQGVQLGGKITGLPNHTSVRGIYYNVDYFEKVGLKAPKTKEEAWTWEQLLDAARVLQEKGGAKYGLQFDKRSFDAIIPFLFQNGGSLMNEGRTEPRIQDRAGVETIRWVAELHQKGIGAPGILDGTEDPLKLFASGISAMWVSASNVQIPGLASQMTKFRWDTMVITKHPHFVTVLAPAQWSVFLKADPEAAWKFVSFITSPESMTEVSSAAGTLPVRPALRDRVRWSQRPELLPFYLDMGASGFNAQLQAEKDSPIYGGTKDQLQAELALAASGEKSAEAAAEAMAKLLSDKIKSA